MIKEKILQWMARQIKRYCKNRDICTGCIFQKVKHHRVCALDSYAPDEWEV